MNTLSIPGTIIRGFNDVNAIQVTVPTTSSGRMASRRYNTGANGISRFDGVVAAAKAAGVRLIVALTNNWSNYGGMDVYVNKLNPGGAHDTFYTNQKVITAYQNYIKNFVGRYVKRAHDHGLGVG